MLKNELFELLETSTNEGKMIPFFTNDIDNSLHINNNNTLLFNNINNDFNIDFANANSKQTDMIYDESNSILHFKEYNNDNLLNFDFDEDDLFKTSQVKKKNIFRVNKILRFSKRKKITKKEFNDLVNLMRRNYPKRELFIFERENFGVIDYSLYIFTDTLTTKDKIEINKIKNRLSARNCRYDLKSKVGNLVNENYKLREENKNLRILLQKKIDNYTKLEKIIKKCTKCSDKYSYIKEEENDIKQYDNVLQNDEVNNVIQYDLYDNVIQFDNKLQYDRVIQFDCIIILLSLYYEIYYYFVLSVLCICLTKYHLYQR